MGEIRFHAAWGIARRVVCGPLRDCDCCAWHNGRLLHCCCDGDQDRGDNCSATMWPQRHNATRKQQCSEECQGGWACSRSVPVWRLEEEQVDTLPGCRQWARRRCGGVYLRMQVLQS